MKNRLIRIMALTLAGTLCVPNNVFAASTYADDLLEISQDQNDFVCVGGGLLFRADCNK